MRLRRLILPALALVALAACSDEAPVSGPGTMTATVVGPNGAEGAAVLTLLGDGIGAISAVGGSEVHVREGDSMVRVVLIDPAGGDLAFQVAVPDTTAPPASVILQVAGPDDALRPSVDDYSLEFVR